MIGKQISHYNIVEEIGRGGMGVVYRAEDVRLGRTVALKFLAHHLSSEGNARDRFMQEARAVAALNHANIATLYDIVEEGQNLFIAMEYLKGADLSRVMSEGDLPLDLAVNYAIQIARGLERAHDEGIIHRDIKPANIMVTSRQEIKILDFGLAKISGIDGISNTGTTVGTAAYMSPQQIRGEVLDNTTDLWGLGVVLYEMLTGRRPFEGEYEHALYYSILNVDPTPISEIKPDLGTSFDSLISRLLSKEPKSRFKSAAELITSLESLDELPAAVSGIARSSRTRQRSGHSSVSEERRQITVLYCEIDRIGDLSESLDPEDLWEIEDDYQPLWETQVQKFEGRAGPFSGGTLFAFFGYPIASENDTRRAISCGLAIQAATSEMIRERVDQGAERPQIRIGIHTGIAVVGEEEGEIRIRGNAEKVAAGLTDHIQPGSIVVSKSVYQLERTYFSYSELGARAMKGFSEPLPLFEVVKESGAQTRLDFVEDADLSPLVGREIEMKTLRRQLRQAVLGRGNAILITGEAGLGKSRLVNSFITESVGQGSAWNSNLYCSSFNTNSALHPFARYLKDIIWPTTLDEGESEFESLRNFLKDLNLLSDSNLSLISDLLGLKIPDTIETPQTAPAAQKQQTMQVLLQILTAKGTDQPGLLLLEDLHWADPSTKEWIDLLIGQLPTLPLLVLFTTRPEYRPAWLGRPRTSEISLNRLEKEDLFIISEHRSGKTLPKEILEKIAEKTDGIPLFVEELTNMILEAGILKEQGDRFVLEGPIPEHLIPNTLQGMLVARLDRFSSEKYVAEIGSVVGRQFSFEIVAIVSGQAEDDVSRDLAALVEAELIYQRGFIPHATFIFKHALIQDAAYNGMIRSRRTELHKGVALALERSDLKPESEIIAHHYSNAALPEKAIPHWMQAGQRAMTRYENEEAVQHLTAGHQLIPKLPEGEERDLLELGLLLPLGHALNMTKGYWAPEGEAVLSRVAELCRKIDAMEPLAIALLGLSSTYMIRGDYERSMQCGIQSREAVDRLDRPDFTVVSDITIHVVHLFQGKFDSALEDADRLLEAYDSAKHEHLRQYGYGSLDTACRSSRSLALAMTGYCDQALAQLAEMRLLSREFDYHFDVYEVHLWSGLSLLGIRDYETCTTVMDEYLVLGREYGDPFPVMISTVIRNLALRDANDLEEFRTAKLLLDQMRAAGYGLGLTLLLGQYAAGLLDYGLLDDAQDVIQEAFEHLDRVGTELWEAEIHRIQGEILRAQGAGDETVRKSFKNAIEVARHQNAKLFELRAATSIANHSLALGEASKDIDVVSEIYETFNEGYNCRDLVEAKKLIDQTATDGVRV